MKQQNSLSERVLKVLGVDGPMPFARLARLLNINHHDNQTLTTILIKLMKENKLAKTKDGQYYLSKLLFKLSGTIFIHNRGFGFVDGINDQGEKISVFIVNGQTKDAMSDDEVTINVYGASLKEPSTWQGEIIKIDKRKHLTIVGKVFNSQSGIVFKPINHKITANFIFDDESKDKLEDNTIVKVRVTKFTPGNIYVKHESHLGDINDISIDILAQIEEANVRYVFSPEALDEANHLPETVLETDKVNRINLTNEMIVTIDGDDTKDFDDAIQVKELDNGNFLLGVHIADVAHYVKENSSLDQEALYRGTSIYLVDRVIPMLPEALSNGICSLNPQVERLTMSVEMEIDQNGNTISYKVFESVIKSAYRLTYQEVNAFYHTGINQWKDQKLEKMLQQALKLSKIIRNYKIKQGYIDFEINESKIIVDAKGNTSDIVLRDRLESEMMIEDFMVRANEVIATHIFKQDLAFIYRVHDKPNLEQVNNLQNVVNTLGLTTFIPHNAIPSEFARSINEIKQTRFDDFMKMMMLRTMAKAEYSHKNIGHFGLASDCYTHFTSPIRRYPDLIVHRMLKSYNETNHSTIKEASQHYQQILPNIAMLNSQSEIKATELERLIDDIKKAEFYARFVDQGFEGTIVTVAQFGLFVEFPNKVAGLVHISTLIDGEYSLVNKGYTLASKHRQFTIGDKVRVVVVETIKDEGKISLVLEDLLFDWKKQQANNQNAVVK